MKIDDEKELIGQIIDIFEDNLDDKNKVIFEGERYDLVALQLNNLLKSWNIIENKKPITDLEVNKMFIDFNDEIQLAYDGLALNFYVSAFDYAYIWSGLYKDYTELHQSLEENDCGSCSMYCYYFPETKKIILSFEDMDYKTTDIELENSTGKDLLIKLCEEYCLERECKTSIELLNDLKEYA